MKKYLLKELLEIKNGKDHKDLKDGTIPVFGSGGLMRYVDTAIYDGKSILLPRKGSLDNIQYVNGEFWTVDTLYYSIVDETKAVPFYLFNYINLLDLSNLNTGTGVPSMTFSSYYDIEVKLPSISTQKKIASVLSSLDNKIELNNKVNAELEEMARTIYDYWFVQFDFPDENGNPYKSSGGKMVFNKKLGREIPEGWEVKSLYSIAEYINGLACQKYRPEEGEDSLPVVKIKEMKEGLSDETEKVRFDIPEKYIIETGDILFAWSASLEVMMWTEGKAGLNQHIFNVKSSKYPRPFIYFELLNHLHHFKMMAELRKTTMGHITINHLKTAYISIPPMNLIQQVSDMLEPYFLKIINGRVQNFELASLRDWLLPMLMNGQVSVGE